MDILHAAIMVMRFPLRTSIKIVNVPETVLIVYGIFIDVIAGKFTSQVARELNVESIPTPQQYKGGAGEM